MSDQAYLEPERVGSLSLLPTAARLMNTIVRPESQYSRLVSSVEFYTSSIPVFVIREKRFKNAYLAINRVIGATGILFVKLLYEGIK